MIEPTSTGPDELCLALIPLDAFIERWRALVGEPPAVMLSCRAEMIRLLVQSIPVAGLPRPPLESGIGPARI